MPTGIHDRLLLTDRNTSQIGANSDYLLLTDIALTLFAPTLFPPSHRLLLRPPGSHYLHRTRLGLGIAAVSGLARSRPWVGGLAGCGARRRMGTLVTLRVPVYQWVPVYRTMTTLASALERLPHYLALTILLSLSCSHHLALTILLSPSGGGAGAAPDDGAD
jgi:hypothetical protein